VTATAVLGEWRGEHVKVGEVLEALDGLRRGEQRTATRTSVLNLVVVAADEADAARASEAIEGLGGRHPGRTLVLAPGPSDGSRLNAEVRLLGAEVEGHGVWSEQVRLTACGALWDHLDSLIEPFTLPDLPVAVWYVSDLPPLADRLLAAADVVLVDSKELGDVLAFPHLAELARRRSVVDLSWARLRPWRELLASLFEGEAFRPLARRVDRAEVHGKEGPRYLLAGWLASRLALSPGAVELHEARHVALRLHAGGSVFEAVRHQGERVVRAAAEVEGGPSHHEAVSLPHDSLPRSLAMALTHLERDRVWEQALRGALAFPA
jgi:glucose-6-phosphate dehydrogenase assembly protein OpcA